MSTDDFPVPRIVLRSLDSMLRELPVDNLVIVTDPMAELELVDMRPVEFEIMELGKSLFRTGEIVTLLSRLAANNFIVLSTLEL